MNTNKNPLNITEEEKKIMGKGCEKAIVHELLKSGVLKPGVEWKLTLKANVHLEIGNVSEDIVITCPEGVL
jgi:hypothetical protein